MKERIQHKPFGLLERCLAFTFWEMHVFASAAVVNWLNPDNVPMRDLAPDAAELVMQAHDTLFVTMPEDVLAAVFDVNVRTIQRVTRRLIEQGLLERFREKHGQIYGYRLYDLPEGFDLAEMLDYSPVVNLRGLMFNFLLMHTGIMFDNTERCIRLSPKKLEMRGNVFTCASGEAVQRQ